MEKFTPEQLKSQTTQAQEKIKAGNADLETIRDYVQNNLPDLIAQASQDYQQEMQEKIEKAVQEKDLAKTKELIEQVQSHIENLAVGHGLTPEQIQQFTAEYDAFWKDTYKEVSVFNTDTSHKIDTSQIQFTPEFKLPTEINFQDLAKQSFKQEEFGKYITNPETSLLDYESLGEPVIFDPNTDTGYRKWLEENSRVKLATSVMDYFCKTYARDHHIPGIEYQKYLFENQDKIPNSLKDGNRYYTPGSVLRDAGGFWSVPYLFWWHSGQRARDKTAGLDRFISPVENSWCSDARIVLFKK